MILPDKHIRLSRSLLNVGAVLLGMMDTDHTVTELWDRAKKRREIRTFDRFVDGMDLLFLLGAVRFSEGVVSREASRGRRSGAGRPAEHAKTGAAAQ